MNTEDLPSSVHRRTALSLLELLLVISILGLIIALLLPAVAKVRESARVAYTVNNERQLILGVHDLSAARDDQIRNLPKNSPQLKPIYRERSLFWLLLPYVHMELVEPGPGATRQQLLDYFYPQVKVFIDPQDPSLDNEWVREAMEFNPPDTRLNRASYAANIMAFDGVLSLTSSIPDGHSNTIAFTTHYFHCGTNKATDKYGWVAWDAVIPAPNIGDRRRATFADAGCRDVVPVREPGTGRTVPSRPGATFEVRPPINDADARLPHAFYQRGIQVAYFDGSVRTIRPSVDPSLFWSLVTPNGGEVVVVPD